MDERNENTLGIRNVGSTQEYVLDAVQSVIDCVVDFETSLIAPAQHEIVEHLFLRAEIPEEGDFGYRCSSANILDQNFVEISMLQCVHELLQNGGHRIVFFAFTQRQVNQRLSLQLCYAYYCTGIKKVTQVT